MKRYQMTVQVLVEAPDRVPPDCLAVAELTYGAYQAGILPGDIAVLECKTVRCEPSPTPDVA